MDESKGDVPFHHSIHSHHRLPHLSLVRTAGRCSSRGRRRDKMCVSVLNRLSVVITAYSVACPDAHSRSLLLSSPPVLTLRGTPKPSCSLAALTVVA